MSCETKIIAHRGYSSLYPENTLHAFKEAVITGADGIELDVQLSKDGEVVIYHDFSLKANTQRSELVHELTVDELTKTEVRAGALEIRGNTICTLRQYFAFIKDKNVFTNIELKNTEIAQPGLEEKVLALIDEYNLRKKVLFSSFNHLSLRKLRNLAPDIPCAALVSGFLDGAGAYAEARGFSWINPIAAFVTEDTLEEMRAHHTDVQVWTVDDEETMEWLFKHNVYAIITNKPELAYAVRQGI